MKKALVFLILFLSIHLNCFAEDYFGYGIEIEKQNDDIVLKKVMKNSKADKLGLKDGLKIINLNGKKPQKISDEMLKDIDNKYKQLKITFEEDMKINLRPENITLVQSYNNVKNTYNNDTKYQIENYNTDKILLADYLDNNKHVKYMNAYFNYADAISINNSKEYIELFNITKQNIEESIIKAKNDENSVYYKLYNLLLSNYKNYGVIGKSCKYFLELAIYTEQNKQLIDRQISEFDSEQKKQYAKYVYNTRIIANLLYLASLRLSSFSYEIDYNMNKINEWKNEFKIENELYNNEYKKLSKILSKNKIEFKKPGALSTLAQTTNNPPEIKYISHKQIVDTAKAVGYNPKSNSTYKLAFEKREKERIAKEEARKIAAAKIEAEQKAAITFFGGFPYDTNYTEILKYFDKLPTVTSIKIGSSSKNFKGLVTDNILNDYFLILDTEAAKYKTTNKSTQNKLKNISNTLNQGGFGLAVLQMMSDSSTRDFYTQAILHPSVYFCNITFYDGSTARFVDFTTIPIYIDSVSIAGIAFKIKINLKAQPFYYFYNKNKNLKYYKGGIVPFYEIESMGFEEKDNITYYNSNTNNELIDLYRNKYGKYKTYSSNYGSNKDVYSNENMDISVDKYRKEIGYYNKKFNRYKDKYNKELNNIIQKKRTAESLNSAI